MNNTENKNNIPINPQIQKISFWLTNYFKLKNTKIEIHEAGSDEISTHIKVHNDKITPNEFHINKKIINITIDDIENLPNAKKMSFLMKSLIRFFTIWVAIGGLYAVYNVCPICGQIGCPVGYGVSITIGGIAAFILQGWKILKIYANKIITTVKDKIIE